MSAPNATTAAAASRLNAATPDNFGAFSAAQITAHIDNVQIGTLTSINYSVHTEKVAQYTFGSANPRRFVTGKRAIAGSMTFNMFDRSALLAIFAGANNTGRPIGSYQGNDNTNSAAFKTEAANANSGTTATPGVWAPFQNSVNLVSPANSSGQFNTSLAGNLTSAYANAAKVPLEYTDQLPPFDLTLTMVDNTGAGSYMVIGGMEIINEGGGYNIDDMVTQVAYTYVARYMRPLTPVDPNGSPVSTNAVPYTSAPVNLLKAG